MWSTFYKISLFTFNLLNVLCLKFDGNECKVSKRHYYTTVVILTIHCVFGVVLAVKNGTLEIMQFFPFKLSIFAQIFYSCVYLSTLFIVALNVYYHLKSQDDFAKILNKFIKFYKFSNKRNFSVDYQKIRKQTLLAYCCMIVMIFFLSLMPLLSISTWLDFFLKASMSISVSYHCGSAFFLNFVLAHMNFLLENFDNLLDQELNKYYHDHQGCRDFCILLNEIHEAFELVNKSIGIIISFSMTRLLSIFIQVVSMNF
jgi:hypothetical protein